MDYAEILQITDAGAANEEIQRALAEVIQAVGVTGGAGTLTVKLKIAPGKKKDMAARKVTVSIAASVPRREIAPATLFADDDGGLHLENPHLTMFDPAAPKRRGRRGGVDGVTIAEIVTEAAREAPPADNAEAGRPS